MARAGRRVHRDVHRPVLRLGLPGAVRRFGRGLLDQNLWCLGRDIARPEGNLLTGYGFTRERPPEGAQGSSSYSYSPTPGTRLVLWGFGVFYGDEARGGVYLRRRTFSPALVPAPEREVWNPGQISGLHTPATGEECRSACALLRDLCDVLYRYEAWVRDCPDEGLASYRQRCVADWPKAVTPAGEMPDGWLYLMRFFDRHQSPGHLP